MKTVTINLGSIDKVKSFVNDITKFDSDFDLVSGRYVIDAKGAIRKCTVCLTDEKNKVGEIIDRENFHMNFYALSQWTECKLSLDECSNCEFYPVCVGRLCPNAVLEGNTECRFNKQAVYRHIELVADMLYNKRMLNQPK